MTETDPDLPSRRAVLAGLAALIPSCTTAASPDAPPTRKPKPVARKPADFPDAESIRAQAALPGDTGFALMDIASGEVIEAYQPDGLFIPASVSKMPTTLYALDALGPEHRFVTRLMAAGALEGSVIAGDLALVGGGDPTLDTDGLGGLAEAALRLGVRGATGRFLIDGSALPTLARIDPTQPEHVAYNPSVGALNLNYNRIFLEWSRVGGKRSLALQARGSRFSPEVGVIRVATDPNPTPVFHWAAVPGAEVWTVAEPALGRKGGRWLPVRDPLAYAGDVFRAVSAAQGLDLPPPAGGSVGGGSVVASVSSTALQDILRDMMKHSTNLTAEVVGMSASRARGIAVKSLADSGAAMSAWLRGYAGLGPDFSFANHSGLSPASRISPRQTVQILAAAERASPGRLGSLMKEVSLEPGGTEAALPVPARAHAKTGTLNFVRGLAGYIQGPSGRPLAFAIYSANLAARGGIGADDEEEIPQGSRAWIGRARGQERSLVRSWAARFAV